jgi:hypothetical protein
VKAYLTSSLAKAGRKSGLLLFPTAFRRTFHRQFRFDSPFRTVKIYAMSLTHEQLQPNPIRSQNGKWVHTRQTFFYLSHLASIFVCLVWLGCEEVGPIRRTIFWVALIIPAATCLYNAHLALRGLVRALREIEILESGKRGEVLVMAPFDISTGRQKY